jgi:hypothetical protein
MKLVDGLYHLKFGSELISNLEARILGSSDGAPFEYKAKDFFELEMILVSWSVSLPRPSTEAKTSK